MREEGVRLTLAEPLPLAIGAGVAVKVPGERKPFEGRYLRNFATSWIEFASEDGERLLAASEWESGEQASVAIDTKDGLPAGLALQAVVFLGAAAGLVDPLGEIARNSALTTMIVRAHREHVRKVARALLCWGTCLRFPTPGDWKRAAAAVDDQDGAATVRTVADRVNKDESAADDTQAAGDALMAASTALRDASESKDVEEFAERTTWAARELLQGLRSWEAVMPPRKRS